MNGEAIRIAGSVLGLGANNPTNGIVGIISGTGDRPLNLTHHSLANGQVNFGADVTIGGTTYPTIQSSSSAVNIGLYVRKSGGTYYFSENNTDWFTGFADTGGLVTPVANLPAGTVDLTATDITGYTRTDLPDAGVYEYRP